MASHTPYPNASPAPTKADLQIPSPGFIDQNGYVHIPITISKYFDPTKKLGFREKITRKVNGKADGQVKMIAMTRGDYEAFWAVDENGAWLPSVRDPPEGRMEWLRTQERVNEEWRSWGQITELGTSRWTAVYW